ncbi:D-serine ammonia-lyase [uncultured Castellaniella sp.]|uniref:D-serine ammonia-lyase n=1 Tax=uncultured Castellaniella sp. TaxID=647907 RepID=UPI00262DA6EA|nr:D-serine ammonia-lyase [uncultured Castellaniella sp.]
MMDPQEALDPETLRDLREKRPLLWLSPSHDPADEGRDLLLDPSAAHARFERCAGLLARLFPELEASGGRLSSPLSPIPGLQRKLSPAGGPGAGSEGVWFLKRDDILPVAGSVKARGGFHEALALAERLALEAGLLDARGDRARLAEPPIREHLGRHTLSVGSTGNLGLAIGLIGAGLGFHAAVHMSSDAKAWKKDRLRGRGITVVEHAGDYAAAVASGRAAALDDPLIHFVDDERSEALFLGYAAAARELLDQLRAARRPVDAAHPLFVHLPCGVGGAPGGITYGLKRLLGPHVHCFFAEPTASPCMLVQVAAGLQAPVSVHDIGLDNRTEADGLAVGLASPLAAPIMSRLMAGVFTVDDDTLYRDALALERAEGISIEPSAAAGLRGPLWLLGSPHGRRYLQRHGLVPAIADATHVIWSTGGALVPEDIRALFRARGAGG